MMCLAVIYCKIVAEIESEIKFIGRMSNFNNNNNFLC